MASIFDYTDYRDYLRDHYHQRKAANKSYSFRFFARKAGLESPNYYKLVMDGQRNLTHHNIRKFAVGLNLSEREAHYFENLVYYNQAKKQSEQAFFQKNLALVRSHNDRGLLSQDQYAVLSQWYPLVIKELALIETFYAKPKWIAARLDYRITPVQAREALELLERLKLIVIDPKTKAITVTQQSLQTPDVTHSQAVVEYYKQILQLAAQALEHQSEHDRCFSALVVSVNKKDLAKAFARIHEFRNELDSLFAKSKTYQAVYQLNMNLFRLDADVE